MSEKTNILYPVEILNRELDFRLFLSCLTAKKTNRIFIGQHDAIYRLMKHMRGGVYVGKNMFIRGNFPTTDLTRYGEIKQKGFIVIHLNEEGGFFSGDMEMHKTMLDLHLDPRVLAAEDRVCTWGDFQRDHYRSKDPKCRSHIETTGHPRFDILKPEKRAYFTPTVERLHARLGDFILINTNLTFANNSLGVAHTFAKDSAYYSEEPVRRTDYLGAWACTGRIFPCFIELLNLLSIRFPETNIVLRPHPSEDFNFYKLVFKNVKNIHILHEGSVIPWLLACKVLIHNGCTTAVEGTMVGAKVITYKPYSDMKYEMTLPNLVGVQCTTQEEVVDNVVKAFDSRWQEPSSSAFDQAASPILYNLHGDSFERLAKVIAEAEAESRQTPASFDRTSYRLTEAAHQAVAEAKKLVRPFFSQKQRDYEALTGSGNFYGFDPADIREKLGHAQRILGIKVKLELFSREMMSIESE